MMRKEEKAATRQYSLGKQIKKSPHSIKHELTEPSRSYKDYSLCQGG